MAYLFDTDAISEVYKRRPNGAYLAWLANIPRRDQFTSAVVIGEMYAGAFLVRSPARFLANIRDRLLQEVTVLPFDVGVAEVYGRVRAELQRSGRPIPDTDLQIAATAIAHGLTLVTGNVRHHARVPGIELSRVLAEARAGSR